MKVFRVFQVGVLALVSSIIMVSVAPQECIKTTEPANTIPVAQHMVQVITPATESNAEPHGYWAECRVTAYCPCEKCCGVWATKRPKDERGNPIVVGASGVQLESKVTCASSLPFGTVLYIPELELRTVVQDRAADWIDEKYDSKYVDIYIDDHAECFEYLSGHNEYMSVYIEE